LLPYFSETGGESACNQSQYAANSRRNVNDQRADIWFSNTERHLDEKRPISCAVEKGLF